MLTFGNQLKAIFYKNWLVSKKNFMSHFILLFLVPLLVVISNDMFDVSIGSYDDYKPVKKQYIGEDGQVQVVEPKVLVVCNDGDTGNLALKAAFESVLGPDLMTHPLVDSEISFNNLCIEDAAFEDMVKEDLACAFFIRSNDESDEKKQFNIGILRQNIDYSKIFLILNAAFQKMQAPAFHKKSYKVKVKRMNMVKCLTSRNSFVHGMGAGCAVLFSIGVFIAMGIDEKKDKGFMLMRLNA